MSGSIPTFNYRSVEDSAMRMYPSAAEIAANAGLAESVRVSSPVIESAAGQDGGGGVTFPTASAYASLSGQSIMALLAQQEPRAADTASPVSDQNFSVNSMEFDSSSSSGFHTENRSRAESISSHNAAWTEATMNSRVQEQMNSFEFLLKSVCAANNFVSMLTREQLQVFQSMRPSLLYEFLHEIARARTEKRSSRRIHHQDCAFCKNNGESEECYSSHTLKDWRGRVLCPVLRAFRCPRCGATGDRAHTIKYCPDNNDTIERAAGLSSRRRVASSPLFFDNLSSSGEMPTSLGPLTPNAAPSPAPVSAETPMSHNSVWPF